MSRRGNPPWRLGPQTREQRRLLRRPRAALEARARKAELHWQRAREAIRAAGLPGGCIRVVDQLAERHQELGKGCHDQPVYQGYGHRGDRRREASARQSELPALAEATGLTRRWTIACIALLVAAGMIRKLPGGRHPHGARWTDGSLKNEQQVTHCHYLTGGTVERRQAVGGAGWANGYLVEGIPDPEPEPEPEPEPSPRPEPEPESRPERFREILREHEQDRLERQRARLRGP